MADADHTAMSAATATPSVVPDEHTLQPIPTVWDMVVAKDFFSIEIKMVLSAILIIYVGAHASIRRPPSAAPPTKLKRKGGKLVVDDEKEHFAQGFQATDAIVFPFIAAAVLIGLYYLIKWLQDPAILNMILRLYMAMTGILSIGVFFGDIFQFMLNIVSPDYWADRSGRVFEIDPASRTHKLLKAPREDGSEKEADPEKRLPFPGFASALNVSAAISNTAWGLRHFLKESCVLRIKVPGDGFTGDVKITSIIGFALGCAVEGLYLYTESSMLSNVIGLSVCYMAFNWMSVTSFSIGTMVLVGLFFYDIVMVFYTPFMVAVATQVDAPLKLTYETAGGRSSLLGLGDIVIPGIFICLALRFDLWRHYQRKVTRVQEDLKTVTKGGKEGEVVAENTTADEVTTVKTAYRTVKAPFVDPRGQWGNFLWTTSPRDLVSGRPAVKLLSDADFPKTYFRVTLLGYLVGMLATLVVLVIFKHGQPALLYLVPGVAGSAWLTGLIKGDLKDMWEYTEDGSLDVEDVVVEVDGEGNVIEEKKKADSAKDAAKGKDEGKEEKEKEKKAEKEKSDYELFAFSITVPKEISLKED
ncbi:putative signal peptide peptidase [Diaporthe ampelina]|uniref:Putative signal peptide peptidase n=1 Tax=Diaporthe ampelina TaxID=1214573 RepID=A0A0G2FYL9_9PEZI|nr:putative signal peptide peptidase [Diaporthe ampelina]